MTRLVLATSNPDKTREIVDLFRPLGLEIVPMIRLLEGWSVEEAAGSLAGNALLKAQAARAVTGEPAIADDTGLFVDALGGAPGVRSSRYAGPSASYADNVQKLLKALQGVPQEERGARFRTLVALVRRDGVDRLFEGRLDGRILESPRGGEGFGYDPVFFVPEEGCSLAEVALAHKNAISHRSRAFEAAAAFLSSHPDWLEEGAD